MGNDTGNDTGHDTGHDSAIDTNNNDCAHIVLIDMDNTLVDYDKEFGKRMKQRSAGKTSEDIDAILQTRQQFEVEKNFPADLQTLVKGVMNQQDFFHVLQPFPGAIKALREMDDAGLHVKLCTSPSLFQYESSARCKYAWVRQWLGEDWMSRLVITRDKTVVRGRVLIDDKPVIRGACVNPEWAHVVYTMPYNATIDDRPRISDWSNWRSVLAPFFEQLR